MGKIGLIIQREIFAKLRNKTFITMTFLAPLLVAGFFALMIWLTMADKTEQNILVIDETQSLKESLTGNDYITFTFTNDDLNSALSKLYKSDKSCILYIPSNFVEGAGGAAKIFYKKAPGLAVQSHIRNQLENIIYEEKLKANKIDPNVIHNAKFAVKLIITPVDELGKHGKELTEFKGVFGFVTGLFMFMFIMMYGMMVFRSVMEEKTNRIVEIIVSSVKPFQLMLGKIIGIAILGIAQFITMSLLSIFLISVLSATLLKDVKKDMAKFQAQQEQVFQKGASADLDKLDRMQGKIKTFELLEDIQDLNFAQILFCFILYFLGGYLFYSSLLAAIGSAVDAESDSQQFMFPVMLPLIAGYFIAIRMITNPESAAALWGSMIPFTSPIVMMARLPNGVPFWQLAVSITVLMGSFVAMVWLAGKIYRVGILMYGKKNSWREILKWVFYK